MKGTFKLFTLVLMAMSVFSCSKESVKEFEDEINRGAVTITAGINNDAKTKTTLGDTSGESTKVYWEEGDSFVLSIGGEDYTFDINPAYSNENPSTYATFTCADAPKKIAAGDYVAKYSNVATPTQQAGTKEGLSDYQYMEADIDIDTERNLEDVSIKFYTKVSVVELTLTHNDFKDAAVSSIALRNGGAAVAEIDGSASFTGDSNGKIVVYFAVPAGKEFTAATITATCGENAYVATINSALTTVEGKLYQVKKSMTCRTVVSSGTCGANLKWEITYTNDENSLTLSITGTGDMDNYRYSSPLTPAEYIDKITSVEFPNGLTSIGKYAFYQCKKLENVTFEAGSQLKTIGDGAFRETGLTSIEIPATVTEIGISAFCACSQLSTVTFGSGSQLKTIGYYAFDECESLTSIKIPETVTVIGSAAFRNTDIASIEIPASVTEIGGEAFKYCTSLVAVHCRPATPPKLGENVFYTNGTGRTIYVPKSSAKDYKEAKNWSTYKDHIIGEK